MERRMMVMVCALALIVDLGFAETATMAAGKEATVNLNSPDAILKTIPAVGPMSGEDPRAVFSSAYHLRRLWEER